MTSNFKATEYPNSAASPSEQPSIERPKTEQDDTLTHDADTPEDNELQEDKGHGDEAPDVVTLISGTELEQPEIKRWALHSLQHEVDPKVQAREQEVYSELEKKIQPEIDRQTEILKKEAYEEAKNAGFDAGYKDGKVLGQQEAKDIALAQSETQLAEKMASLDALLESLSAPYKLIETEVFEQLSSLALHIAEEVIQQKITDNTEWILQTIHQAIEALSDDLSPLEIVLNPADFELVSDVQPEFSDHWSVKEDEKIERGACQVKQNHSSVEHNWRNRFESMSLKLQTQAVAEATE